MDANYSDSTAKTQDVLGSRYELIRKIGSGGFADVWEALDRRLGVSVAIKILRPDLVANSETAARFVRETRLLSGLRHPNIIPILDVLEDRNLYAYVMPLVEGDTLRHKLQVEGALPIDDAIRLTREIADALGYAHGRGVLHRDLKPENILLQQGHALISDFGIARALMGSDSEALTGTGLVLGTPGYMSPEQGSGAERVDGRSDVYSLAAITYELLAGRPAYVGGSPDGILRQQLSGAPTPLEVQRPAVPPALARVVDRGLAPNPADRFTSAHEFSQAIERPLGTPAFATPAFSTTPSQSRIPARAPRPHAWWIAIAVTVAVLAVAFVVRDRFVPSRSASTTATNDLRGWFVVADVASSPEDRQSAAAIRSLLNSALEQSSRLGVLSESEMASVLRSAGRPESTFVDGELAKELAMRARIKGALTPELVRSAEGAFVRLRAFDVRRESLLVSERTPIVPSSEILRAAETLARRTIARLERDSDALMSSKHKPTVNSKVVWTRDFTAWRLADQAQEKAETGDQAEAIALFRASLARDSSFMAPRGGLAVAYLNLGLRDSAANEFEHAIRQMSARGGDPTGWQAQLLQARGDRVGYLRLMARAVDANPSSTNGWVNRGIGLAALGRHEEAVTCYERSRRLDPASARNALPNEMISLLVLNRKADARTALNQISDPLTANTARLWYGLLALGPDSLAAIAHATLELTDQDIGSRTLASATLAGLRAQEGDVQGALKLLEDAAQTASRDGNPHYEEWSYWSRDLLLLVTGTPSTAPPHPRASRSMDARITAGLDALVARKPAEARRIAAELEKAHSNEMMMLEGAPELLRAWAAFIEGNSSQVIQKV